jgi:peptide-methionine (R)-S-oxide reductase
MKLVVPILVALLVSGALFGAILSESAPAFEVSYTTTFAPGIYRCASCGATLFRSEDKFASTERWPAFRAALPGAVATRRDTSEGLDRVEVLCARCGAHLGHVFPDGRLAGDTDPNACMRYCVLSKGLSFSPRNVEVVVPDKERERAADDRAADGERGHDASIGGER